MTEIALHSRSAQGLFIHSAELAMFDERAGLQFGHCLA
jgi:hypothetical protein